MVDDAIVVVENVEHNMRALHLSATDAAKRAMSEVSGPVISIRFCIMCSLCSCGISWGHGRLSFYSCLICNYNIYFCSAVISGTVACYIWFILLKHEKKESKISVWVHQNKFDCLGNQYVNVARYLIVRPLIALILFGSVCCLIFLLFQKVPTSFVPNEDQEFIMGVGSLPDGSSLRRVDAVT